MLLSCGNYEGLGASGGESYKRVVAKEGSGMSPYNFREK